MTGVPLESLATASGPVDPRQVIFPAEFDDKRVKEILIGDQETARPRDPFLSGRELSPLELEKILIATERKRIFYLLLAKFLREHERFEKLLRERNYQLLPKSEGMLVKLASYPIGKLDRVSKKMQEVTDAITAFLDNTNLSRLNSDQLGNFALFISQPWRTQEQQKIIRRRLSETETKIMAPMAHSIWTSGEPVEWAQLMVRELILKRLKTWLSLDMGQAENRNRVIEGMRAAMYDEWFGKETETWWVRIRDNLMGCAGRLDHASFILAVCNNIMLLGKLHKVVELSVKYHMRGIVTTTQNLIDRCDQESEVKLCAQVSQFAKMYNVLSVKQKNRGHLIDISQEFIENWRDTFCQWRELALKIQSGGLQRTLREMDLGDELNCVDSTSRKPGTIKDGLRQIESSAFLDALRP